MSDILICKRCKTPLHIGVDLDKATTASEIRWLRHKYVVKCPNCGYKNEVML